MASIMKMSEDDFDDALSVALDVIRSKGVFIYPTDTVYGIGGDATSKEVVAKIHRIKGSSADKPLSVMVSDFDMLDQYCDTGLWEDMVLEKYLPGPYTFIVKERNQLPVSNTGRLGVRIPNHRFCRDLCRLFEKPIISTSANLHGSHPPDRFSEIDPKLLDKVVLALDSGRTKQGGPSAIIDLVDKTMIRANGQVVKLLEE